MASSSSLEVLSSVFHFESLSISALSMLPYCLDKSEEASSACSFSIAKTSSTLSKLASPFKMRIIKLASLRSSARIWLI